MVVSSPSFDRGRERAAGRLVEAEADAVRRVREVEGSERERLRRWLQQPLDNPADGGSGRATQQPGQDVDRVPPGADSIDAQRVPRGALIVGT
jgi:hypothetical protein